jgi:multicomponent Na+:H+ antiporter subunit E
MPRMRLGCFSGVEGDYVTRTLGLAAALAAFWVLLSGYWLPLIIALGIASIALCVVIARRLDVCDREGYPIHLTVPGITYFPWLVKEIVVSNITVAKAILTGDVNPQVLQVRASQSDALGRTVYANSITLTPGTVSISVDEDVITVHALMDETADGLRSGEMNARVCNLMGDSVPTDTKHEVGAA